MNEREIDEWYFSNNAEPPFHHCMFDIATYNRPCAEVQCKHCPHTQTEPDNAQPKADNVMHPNHYARWAMEPIEFIATNDLPWWLANVIKYCMRYDAKDGLQDLYKARSYLEMKVRQLEGEKRFWDNPVSVERALHGAEGWTGTPTAGKEAE